MSFPPVLPEDRARLWAVGDSADGGARAARVAAAVPPAAALDAFLYLGDVYDNGTAKEYARRYDPVYGRVAAITAPTPGNHEWDRRAEGYDAYWARVHGRAIPPWYAFSAGGWLVLSLSSQARCGEGSAQLAWLRATLAASDAPVLAFWHRPRYSAGEHGDQADVAPLWRALAGRAAAVLSGHDHNLQRFHPVDGIVQFVVGAGGHSSYALVRGWRRHLPRRWRRGATGWRDGRLAFGDDAHDGALRLELTPGRLSFAFVAAADGRVLDAGELLAPGAPSPAEDLAGLRP
jgi:hypothetical protein